MWGLLVALACAPAQHPAATPAGTPQGDSVVVVVGPEGGTIELPGVLRVVFSPGTFPKTRQVTLVTTDMPSTASGRTNGDVSVGGQSLSLPYDMRVRVGDDPPATPFDVAIIVPADFLGSIPSNHQPALFAQFLEGGGAEALEVLRKVTSTFDAEHRTLRAQVPLAAVLPPAPPDTRNEVVLVVGSLPH